MTVRELMDAIQNLPPDTPVVVWGAGSAEGELWEAERVVAKDDHYWNGRFKRDTEVRAYEGGPVWTYQTWMSPTKHQIVVIE